MSDTGRGEAGLPWGYTPNSARGRARGRSRPLNLSSRIGGEALAYSVALTWRPWPAMVDGPLPAIGAEVADARGSQCMSGPVPPAAMRGDYAAEQPIGCVGIAADVLPAKFHVNDRFPTSRLIWLREDTIR
jgi:hypothetical protein